MSESHAIFNLEEILDQVLSLARQGPDLDRQTLYAAARVNSQWSTIALNYLWSDMTLQHLLYFIGYHNRKYPRCGGCNETSTRQWTARATRFNEFYAHRVRYMFLGFKYTDKLCAHFGAALSTISLFHMPKLHTLKLNIFPHPRNLELSQKFLQPTLERLSCKICKRVGMTTYPSVKEVLGILDTLTTAYNVSYFRLRISLPREIPAQAFVDAFKDMANLEEVDLPPYLLSPTLISALSAHPSLKRVTCVTRPARGPRGGKFSPWDGSLGIDFDGPAPSPADRFSNLTHISLCTSLETASGLLSEGFSPGILVSVNIMLRDLVLPSQVLTFTRQLSARHARLQQFRLSAPEFDFSTIRQSAPRMLWSSLRPLRDCSHIQDFEVFWHTIVIITNEDIMEISKSWPKLRRLVLEGVDPQHVEEEATLSLDCLAPLAQNCLDLRHLSLHLSPALADNAETKTEDDCSYSSCSRPALFPNMSTAVFHLGLPLPPTHEVLRIAGLIGDAFPPGCVISCPYLYKCERVSLDSGMFNQYTSPGAPLTSWQTRQLNIMKFWQSVIWTLPEGQCKVRVTGDYEPRYS
ncbi:hypothetical protein BDY19DRAFT_994663 [Irpex rosettiformis]|uniref:Uncharacterized protein n=1 Tax=Irpex rosettiformis TaxID=378272 RepID=A0ACB8U0E9_9APHY|nr:hypothetical protein BDY19DRAFT_994663 [Irpex rosettiformis]